MKSNKWLKLLVIVLSIIIVILLMIILNNNKNVHKVNTKETEIKIQDSCTADNTMKQFNKLAQNADLTLCGGLNQFNITDITLDGKKQDVYVRFYKGTVYDDNTFTGVYINGERAVPNASIDFFTKLAVSNDLLFVVSNDKKKTNIVAFDSDADNIFDLSKMLEEVKVPDPSLGDVLKVTNIDFKNIVFGDHEVTFNTNTTQKCQNGTYSGSTFKITYNDEGFNNPVFVNSRTCN